VPGVQSCLFKLRPDEDYVNVQPVAHPTAAVSVMCCVLQALTMVRGCVCRARATQAGAVCLTL
jgi:hypothetical protein